MIRFHLDFLRNIDTRGELFYEEKFIRNAVRRYEYVWIPLVHKLTSDDSTISDLDIAPPLGMFHIFVSFQLKPVLFFEIVEIQNYIT